MVTLKCDRHGEADEPTCADCGVVRNLMRMGWASIVGVGSGGFGRLAVHRG